MSDRSFVHLHVHTEYSLLDGLSDIGKLAKRAKALNMPALAISDHGTMFGVIDFYRDCKKNDVKPIVGLEGYVAPRRMTDRDSKLDKRPYHMLLLAENETGYKNLLRIASAGQLEGFYNRPRVDRDFLAAHSEGLIATSGCIAAMIPQMILDGKEQEARDLLDWHVQVFGKDRFYIELQQHDIPELKTINDWLVRTGKRDDIGYVATNDVHYVLKDDYDPHDTLLCIQSSALKTDTDRLRMSDNSYYLADVDEMWQTFGHINDGEPLLNTLKIAEMCSLNLDRKGYHLPLFPVPDGFTDATFLRHLCEVGLYWRYGARAEEAHLRERLDRELGIIERMGFNTYFLIVWDLCEFARAADIWWNVRGSGAGSMAAYCLGITNIDPVENNLLFERFLNPGRVSMPDIDLDYPDDRREDMIRYAVQKYGEDKVAAIITFGTLGAKAAVRDVGRALGVELAKVNAAARLIPTEPKPKPVFDYVEGNAELKQMVDADPELQAVMKTAAALQGVSRHASTHAAGVIIGDAPLVEYLPLHRQTKGGDEASIPIKQVTQFPMETCESLGLLKVDFLGLSTLTIMRRASDLIRKNHGIELTMDTIPYRPTGDPDTDRRLSETFEMISRGETIGVFQVESSGMQQMLRDMRPFKFEHIVAAVSLYRPGPMDYIPVFNRRMHGEEEVVYHHPLMKQVLEETYGIMVYQEQIMQIAGLMFGYSLGDADLMRRAVSKKKKEELQTHRALFVERGPTVDPTITPEVADRIFADIEFFANYGFNKCLTRDTRIVDAGTGRLVTIGELVDGTAAVAQTVSLDTDTLRLTPGKVTAVLNNGVKPVYRLTTRAGRTIRATANHPFYTYAGWRPLGSLSPGELIATPRTLPIDGIHTWPQHQLVVLGHLLAEGNLCHTTGVYYYTASGEQLRDYVEHLEQFDNSQASVSWHKTTYSVYSKRRNRSQPHGLVEWIRALGLWGKDAYTKFIPAEVFTLRNSDIAVLVARMWEGDGHINRQTASAYYATSSEAIARQLQHLLLRFGIVARLYRQFFNYKDGRYGYQVHIMGRDMLRSFINQIGCHFVDSAKCAALQHIVQNLTMQTGCRDIVPVQVRQIVRQQREQCGMPWATVAERGNVAIGEFSRTESYAKRNGFHRSTIAGLAHALNSAELQRYADSDIYWDEIISITPDGEEETYDLTVAGQHNFVANDLIVHNSHAADYAVITVQSAYMKAHYAPEYMAALLSVYFDDKTKVTTLLGECKRLNIPILPPDINFSEIDFDIQRLPDGTAAIRFGMAAIKNAGIGAIQHVLDERASRGPFATLDDLCRRVDLRLVGKRALESLIKVGAFDGLNAGTRPQLLQALDRIIGHSAAQRRAQEQGMVSLFGEESTDTDDLLKNLPHADPPSSRDILNWERELLGIFVSSHPLDPVLAALQHTGVVPSHELRDLDNTTHHGKPVRFVGMIAGLRKMPTKSKDMMGIATLEDRFGTIDAVLFPRKWKQFEALMTDGAVIVVTGTLDVTRGDAQIVVEHVTQQIDAVMADTAAAPPTPDYADAPWLDDAGAPPPYDADDFPLAHGAYDPPSSTADATGYAGGAAAIPGEPADLPPLDLPPAYVYVDPYAPPPPPPIQCVRIELVWEGDADKLERQMRRIDGLLTKHVGRDRYEVVLVWDGGEQVYTFPERTTNACAALFDDLHKVAGVRAVTCAPET